MSPDKQASTLSNVFNTWLLLVLQAVKDLLIHNMLPDRHLRRFTAQPLNHPKMTMKTAVLYWFEDQLFQRVEKLAEALEEGLKTTIDYFKKKCMEIVADLLMSKPEHESRFLTILVNKLGSNELMIC